MMIRLLVLQRLGRYAGEYAPEVLAVVDEHTLDDNPEWWPNTVTHEKAKQGPNSGEFAEIEVVLDDHALDLAFKPTRVGGQIQ